MYPAVGVHRPSGGDAFQPQFAGGFDWFLPADGADFIFWIFALAGFALDAELEPASVYFRRANIVTHFILLCRHPTSGDTFRLLTVTESTFQRRVNSGSRAGLRLLSERHARPPNQPSQQTARGAAGQSVTSGARGCSFFAAAGLVVAIVSRLIAPFSGVSASTAPTRFDFSTTSPNHALLRT